MACSGHQSPVMVRATRQSVAKGQASLYTETAGQPSVVPALAPTPTPSPTPTPLTLAFCVKALSSDQRQRVIGMLSSHPAYVGEDIEYLLKVLAWNGDGEPPGPVECNARSYWVWSGQIRDAVKDWHDSAVAGLKKTRDASINTLEADHTDETTALEKSTQQDLSATKKSLEAASTYELATVTAQYKAVLEIHAMVTTTVAAAKFRHTSDGSKKLRTGVTLWSILPGDDRKNIITALRSKSAYLTEHVKLLIDNLISSGPRPEECLWHAKACEATFAIIKAELEAKRDSLESDRHADLQLKLKLAEVESHSKETVSREILREQFEMAKDASHQRCNEGRSIEHEMYVAVVNGLEELDKLAVASQPCTHLGPPDGGATSPLVTDGVDDRKRSASAEDRPESAKRARTKPMGVRGKKSAEGSLRRSTRSSTARNAPVTTFEESSSGGDMASKPGKSGKHLKPDKPSKPAFRC